VRVLTDPEPDDGGTDDGEPDDDGSVEDIFARLRGDQPESSADEPTADEAAEPPEGAPAFVRREEALAPVDRDLARALKRTLADEQNEVLDLLRRSKPSGVDDLLPTPDDHAARWAAAASSLGDAAEAGGEGTAGSTDDLADELARSITAPLRDRIDRSFAASDGNLDDVADRVRALYREWKGQRLTDACRHYTAAAYARGVFDRLPDDTRVEWVLHPDGGPCPDCDDNVLGGQLTKGEEFPTGHTCAPAHPGCRCLVLPVAD
jgi:hypothetical protein